MVHFGRRAEEAICGGGSSSKSSAHFRWHEPRYAMPEIEEAPKADENRGFPYMLRP